MDELALLLQVHPMEFVAVTETWLNGEAVDQWTFPLSDKILKKIEMGKNITKA